MIIEYLFAALNAVLSFAIGLLPGWTPPEALQTIDDTWNKVVAPVQGLGGWVPFPLMLSLVAIHVGTYVVAFLTKLGLRAFSHVPAAGGAG